jgi:hypothetical protein
VPHRLTAPRTTVEHVDPVALRPAVEDVTRCGCGPTYVPRDNVRREIERLLESLPGEIEPVFLHVLTPAGHAGDDGLTLAGGRRVEVKAAAGQERDDDPPLDGVVAVGAVLCTVGEVDARLEAMIETDGPLAAWIGQSIALAQLEVLEKLAARSLVEAAAERGLQPLHFVEPGVGTRSQQDLFAVLGDGPVVLTEHGTMQPRMSYSFWVTLVDAGETPASPDRTK